MDDSKYVLYADKLFALTQIPKRQKYSKEVDFDIPEQKNLKKNISLRLIILGGLAIKFALRIRLIFINTYWTKSLAVDRNFFIFFRVLYCPPNDAIEAL